MPCFIYENLRLKFLGNSGGIKVPLSNDDCQAKHVNVSPRDRHSFAINAGVDIHCGFPVPHINILVWGQCMGIKDSSGLYLQP